MAKEQARWGKWAEDDTKDYRGQTLKSLYVLVEEASTFCITISRFLWGSGTQDCNFQKTKCDLGSLI